MKELFVDLDGPILDISPKFCKIYFDLFGELDLPVLSCEQYWQLKRTKTPEARIVEMTAPSELVQTYVAKRLAVIEDVQYLAHDVVQPHAVEVIEKLRGRIPVILVTLRNKRRNLMWELDHFDLTRLFDKILTREESHGDFSIKVELIKEHLQGRSCDGLIIGDTEADIKAGQLLGIPTVAVTNGIRTKEYLQSLQPTYIIDSMDQLLNIVERECAL